jgi:hypothetical protein
LISHPTRFGGTKQDKIVALRPFSWRDVRQILPSPALASDSSPLWAELLRQSTKLRQARYEGKPEFSKKNAQLYVRFSSDDLAELSSAHTMSHY